MKPLLGCGADDVVITQSVTGGGFGGKEEYPSMLAAHVALLAKKAERAVKIVYDRDEDIAATTKRHPARVHHRLAVDARGEIVAIDVDVVMDGGAYLTLSPVVLSRGVLHAAGPYRCPVVRVRGRVVATNHPPHGAFRGFGAPQTTFAYERQIEKLAIARGEDPLALRKRLALRSGDTTATGQVLGFSRRHRRGDRARSSAWPGRRRRDAGIARTARRCGAAAASCFYFHGAGLHRLGRAAARGPRDGRAHRRAAGSRCARARPTSARARSRSSRRSRRRRSASMPSLVDVVDPSTAQRARQRARPSRAARAWSSAGSSSRRRRAVRAKRGPRARAGRELATRRRGSASRRDVQYEPPPGIAVGRRDVHRRGVSRVRLGRVPRRRRGRSRHATRCTSIAACRRSTSARRSTRDREGPDRGRHAAGARLGAARERRLQGRQGREREHDELHRADVRRRARARDDPRRGAVSVRAERREGRRRDPDGRAGGGGRERGRGRARLRVRCDPDPARGRSPRAAALEVRR